MVEVLSMGKKVKATCPVCQSSKYLAMVNSDLETAKMDYHTAPKSNKKCDGAGKCVKVAVVSKKSITDSLLKKLKVIRYSGIDDLKQREDADFKKQYPDVFHKRKTTVAICKMGAVCCHYVVINYEDIKNVWEKSVSLGGSGIFEVVVVPTALWSRTKRSLKVCRIKRGRKRKLVKA